MTWGEDGKFHSEHYERIECPMCQNHDRKKIMEVDDLKKPLFFFSSGGKPMYAKKYVCTDCKYEWLK